ncbi:MAG TPA: type III-A CRISPR-associated protein Csm2 [Candidatus Atribacteria bacterium]|nr:MAG: hypothetical protein KIIPBIDF_01083 [Candidatus Methanoperedenaceae archaeon GB50]HEC92305.1 type III-A CRISPR-associated protein Csm2 [Candidatus Atribacteria bacterium]
MKLHDWQETQKQQKGRLQGGKNMGYEYYEKDGKTIKRELFNEEAEKEARILSDANKIEEAQIKMEQNKYAEVKTILENIRSTASSQVRKYYDELRRFKTQIEQEQNKEEKFGMLLPTIKMLRAKIMYAKGRDVVTENFVNFINTHISSLKTSQDYEKFLLFYHHFEAVLGFLKYYEELKKHLLDTAKKALRQQRQRRH